MRSRRGSGEAPSTSSETGPDVPLRQMMSKMVRNKLTTVGAGAAAPRGGMTKTSSRADVVALLMTIMVMTLPSTTVAIGISQLADWGGSWNSGNFLGSYHHSGGIAWNSVWGGGEGLLGERLRFTGTMGSDLVHAAARALEDARHARGDTERGATSEAPSGRAEAGIVADATQPELVQMRMYGIVYFVYVIIAALGIHMRGRVAPPPGRAAEARCRRQGRHASAAANGDGHRLHAHARYAERPRRLLRGRRKRRREAGPWLLFPYFALACFFIMARIGHGYLRPRSQVASSRREGYVVSVVQPGIAWQGSAGNEVRQERGAIVRGGSCSRQPRVPWPSALPHARLHRVRGRAEGDAGSRGGTASQLSCEGRGWPESCTLGIGISYQLGKEAPPGETF